MVVQVITMQAPGTNQFDLKQIISHEYLPLLSEHPGFISADIRLHYPSRSDLRVLLFWESQEALDYAKTGGYMGEAALQLAAHAPGVLVSQGGYVTGVEREAIPS